MEVAHDYGFLMEGTVGISYESLATFLAKETQSLPMTFFELDKCLGMFGNLLAVVLGDLHALMQLYHTFWTMFNNSMQEKTYDLIDCQ